MPAQTGLMKLQVLAKDNGEANRPDGAPATATEDFQRASARAL
jgi:hypothetical protein